MIYVLNANHEEAAKRKYRTDRVCYMPSIISREEIQKRSYHDNPFLLSDRDGAEKEIAYFKRLHRQLMEHDARIHLFMTDRADSKILSDVTDHEPYPSSRQQQRTEAILKPFPNEELLDRLRKDTYYYLIDHHSAEAVRKFFKD
jgi:hypothetical protein